MAIYHKDLIKYTFAVDKTVFNGKDIYDNYWYSYNNKTICLSDYLPDCGNDYKVENEYYDLLSDVYYVSNEDEVRNLLVKYEFPLDDCRNAFWNEKDLVLFILKDIKDFKALRKIYQALTSFDYGKTSVYEVLEAFSEYMEIKSLSEIPKSSGSWNNRENNRCTAIVAAILCCCIWQDFKRQYGNKMHKKYSYFSKSQYANIDDKTEVHYWNIPESQNVIKDFFEQELNHSPVEETKGVYQMPFPYGNKEVLLQYIWEASWNDTEYLNNYEQFKNKIIADENFVIEGIRKSADIILNKKLEQVHYIVDSKNQESYYEVDSLVKGLYIYLASEVTSGAVYKKCELCDNYFISKNDKRKYCDYHIGKNAYYHKKRMNETK